MIGAIVVIAGFLASPLFYETEVNEPLPTVVDKTVEPSDLKFTDAQAVFDEMESARTQEIEFMVKGKEMMTMVNEMDEKMTNEMGAWATDDDTKHNMIMESIIVQREQVMIQEMESMIEDKEIMAKAAKTTTSVSEGMEDMGNKLTTLKTGEFHGLAGHLGQGTVKIISSDGTSFLRFEGFQVTNGPDLFVYITQDGDVHNGVNLGKLKGSMGDQNYELPDGIDTELYNVPVIYCKLFGVYFAEAHLS